MLHRAKLTATTFLPLIIVFVFFSPVSFAATLVDCPAGGPLEGEICLLGKKISCDPALSPATDGCGLHHFITGAKIVINFLTLLSIPLALVLVVIGGGFIMMSGGSQARVATGRTIIASALWGIAIVFAAWLIIATIFRLLPLSSDVGVPIQEQLF